MASEKWIAIGSIVFFVMFAGEMITVYNFMLNVPEDSEFLHEFPANEKIFQFISMGFGPAVILAGVAFIMSRQYGSKQIGRMIIVGGVIMLAGMYVCYSMLDKIDDGHITDVVKTVPILFMILSAPIMGVGAHLTKQKKKRTKKEYF